MEISFLVILWVIFSVAQVIFERQRPPSSTPPPDFEIPTLANDPAQPAEVHEINFAELYRQRKAAVKSEPKKSQPDLKVEDDSKDFGIDLTPASAMNAIILGEILNKPKALRRR